jgi:uncharacterized protein YlxW (UPF0749 family)
MAAEDDHEGTASAPTARPQVPPPQAVMGLLNYITATSLDEDYAEVAKARGEPTKERPRLLGMLVLGVFGALLAIAAIQTAREAPESASSHNSLVKQVNQHKAALVARRAQIARLSHQVNSEQQQFLQASTAGRSLQSRLDRLGAWSGSTAVHGPGVRAVVNDAPDATSVKQEVQDVDLQKLVNGLWESGAEAISINGERLTSLSAIREAGDAITVNFTSLHRPYVVSAIGNPNQLATRFIDTHDGQTWLDLQQLFGLRFKINSEGAMTLPAVSRLHLRYAHHHRGH